MEPFSALATTSYWEPGPERMFSPSPALTMMASLLAVRVPVELGTVTLGVVVPGVVVVLPPVELLSPGVVTVPGAGVEPPRQ